MLHDSGTAVCLGIGLSASADAKDAIALVDAALKLCGLPRDRIDCLATIETRRHHPIVVALAERYKATISTFDAATLETQTPRLKNPSAALFARIGCHGVAEAAALAAAGPDAELILEKMTGPRLSVAIALRRAIVDR